VLKALRRQPGVHYPVLVPNTRGLSDLQALLAQHPEPLTDEISVFTSATDAFNRANLNCTVKESLGTLKDVVRTALDSGLRVRGYVSVVVYCPYSGKVDYKKVSEVAKELVEMGCYEVSLGDTVGRARPHEVQEMIAEVEKHVDIGKLAVSVNEVSLTFSDSFAGTCTLSDTPSDSSDLFAVP